MGNDGCWCTTQRHALTTRLDCTVQCMSEWANNEAVYINKNSTTNWEAAIVLSLESEISVIAISLCTLHPFYCSGLLFLNGSHLFKDWWCEFLLMMVQKAKQMTPWPWSLHGSSFCSDHPKSLSDFPKEARCDCTHHRWWIHTTQCSHIM